MNPTIQGSPRQGDECPSCHVPFGKLSKDEVDREIHTAEYIQRSFHDHSKVLEAEPYAVRSEVPSQPIHRLEAPPHCEVAQVAHEEYAHRHGLKHLFSKEHGSRGFFIHRESREERVEENIRTTVTLMEYRWGPQDTPTFQTVMRYWTVTRMAQHWEFLRREHPKEFRKYLEQGYMEPITLAMVANQELAWRYKSSVWETPAEERLYYLLNNGLMPDYSRPTPIRPLHIDSDRHEIIRRGNARMARQAPLGPQRLSAYRSSGDVFHADNKTMSQEYSSQVPNTMYDARRMALHELADGILRGTDHLETMLLIDVSSSMTWDPHVGVYGPDGIVRHHDQPANIHLVEHLVHRAIQHMVPRAQREHPDVRGINTVTFATQGTYIGQLSPSNFARDWRTKVRVGGGTQVMQGWQVVKNTYFEYQNRYAGHGRFDQIYGWQPTPGMPKLSLLVFLDGEAADMDEFELELLGESWAYVTIVLVGMENCPHHHSHAVELERVARFNPHVGFFDVHGRVCERMVVEEILSSVYPVDPPRYEEILRPEYDLPMEELPPYPEA